MPEVRNVSGDVRDVPAFSLRVEPGGTFTIPDEDVDSWQYQTGVWEVVTAPAAKSAKSDKATPAVTEGA
jgi:hypothetical protein